MTAIVGVLNKHAVAIAADSAITLGDTHKVLNSGNKIFHLSKYAPIGVATYGVASFMGCPWKTIIKQYRKCLGKTKFSKFDDYVENFKHYLGENNFFSSLHQQKEYVKLQIQNFYALNVKLSENRDIYKTSPHDALMEELKDCMFVNRGCPTIIEDFKNYTLEEFMNDFYNELKDVLSKNTILQENEFRFFLESYYYYMRIIIGRNNESGLVFVGYGEEELYPSIKELVVTFGYDNKLQYRFGESTQISNEGTIASITPFAQPDVTHTVIRGINPAFYNILTRVFNDSMTAFKKQIAKEVRTIPEMNDVAKKIESLDVMSVSQSFEVASRAQFSSSYTQPLVNTIASLGIEDLANMAESFVSLTSLIRRMTPKEETVGGPVDVAVISKGDGFIWIKRKHYFDPKLNSNFFGFFRKME